MKKMLLAVVVLAMAILSGCGENGMKFQDIAGPSEAEAASPKTVQGAVIRFSPMRIVAKEGDTVAFDVVVENVSDLYGIAATVLFDSNCLGFVKVEEGGFIRQQNPTSFMSAVPEYDKDQLVIGLSSLGKVVGASGSGTVFRLTFKVKHRGPGETYLKFVDTILANVPATSKDGVTTIPKIPFESQPATIVIE